VSVNVSSSLLFSSLLSSSLLSSSLLFSSLLISSLLFFAQRDRPEIYTVLGIYTD